MSNDPTTVPAVPSADPLSGPEAPPRVLDATGPDRPYLVCGDCANIFLAAGAVRSLVTTDIGLGHECDTHPKEPRPQATSAFEGTPKAVAALFAPAAIDAIDAAPSPPAGLGGAPDLGVHDRPTSSTGFDDLGAERALRAAPAARGDVAHETVGPQTFIALQLLASWTQGKPEACDKFAVEQAAAMARLLLLETKGA